MIATSFVDFFTESENRFRELVEELNSKGYTTDESFGVSRCIFERVSQRHFDLIHKIHFNGELSSIAVNSTAFCRTLGEYVYVIYDEGFFSDRAQIESRLRRDGVF
ncbi:hypothetical protein [Undibacterium sp. Tian12W]|uniref:hypothetical protein n=1 Tax=Undibacterium sp. Tian12W TaxID=3413054 RepID=UPI003BEF869D